ncbi:hypothetical protein C8F04DRAFT_1190490 [Mycena alexandri]|uniref:F-box domain-containing protein n=1 Tax=Mycena alexandri TaxID=1745969 RepID=A0AAD6SJ47_9AGAR|nr:hypothetical protein C8F04DRAFT_1190490 [Mycena alexandri]
MSDRSAPPRTVTSLPPEIGSEAMLYVPVNQLYDVCLVSKYFLGVSARLLYQSVVIDSVASLDLFCRTVREDERKEYCLYVKVFKLKLERNAELPGIAVANCLDNLWRSCLRIKLSVVFWYCILERSPRRVVGRKAHELSCGNETLLRVTPEGPESIEISESNWTTNREIGNIRPLEADKVQQISRPEAWLKFDRLADFGSAARLDMLKRKLFSQQTSIDLKTLRSVEMKEADQRFCQKSYMLPRNPDAGCLAVSIDFSAARLDMLQQGAIYVRFYPRIVTSRPWCWFVDILAQERDISSDSSRLEAGHDYIQPSRPRIVPSGGQLYRALAAKDSWPPPGRNANPTPIALALAN